MKAVKMLILVLLVALLPFQMALAKERKSIDSYEFHDEGIDQHWAYEESENLLYADVMEGFVGDDGRMFIKLNEYITRAQFVKILVNALGLVSDGSGKNFSDVKQDMWYADSIRIASDLGIIDGNDGYFYPENFITRAEITKILVLAFDKSVPFSNEGGKAFADIDHDNWADTFIQKASSVNIVSGYGDSFYPNLWATRAEAFVMLNRALQKEQSDLPEDTELTAVLKDYITSEHMLVETNQFAGIADLKEEYGTGFYQAGGGDPKPFDWFYPAVEEAEINIQIDDENMQFKVIEKSNRFAEVQVTGITVSVQATIPSQPELNQDFTTQMDNGEYHLKKDPTNGKWKIYNYQDR